MKRKSIGFNEKDYESCEKGTSYKMNKKLVDSMSVKSGLTKNQSEKVSKALRDVMHTELSSGGMSR